MKLVIQTQYSENYGSTDKPYWKFKGGDTYIVPNLTPAQAERILRDGIPTLKALIEYKNSASEETVIYYRVVEDDAVVCEDWENPYILSWENNTWVCRQVQLNDGSFRKPVVSKVTKYTMNMGGDKSDLEVSYVVESGSVISYKDINNYIKGYEQA
jgi:hypothetical protein